MSWKIRKQVGVCSGCGKSFQDGEAHFSVLHLSGEEVRREDWCLGCWTAREVPAEDIFWKTRHFLSPQRRRAIDFDALREVFLQLCERRQPGQEALHYLVALLLVRKKVLKPREVRRLPRGEVLVVAFPRSQEKFEIPVPELPPDRLDSLKQELKALFGEGEQQVAEAGRG